MNQVILTPRKRSVTGEKAKQLKGSMVDKEGDVLDAEGNVIGKADLIAGAVGALGSEKPETEAPETEAPELAAPFGVQDNGEITNASGTVIGKLAEGEPRELVGTSIKEIDAEGNLKAESGKFRPQRQPKNNNLLILEFI
jgi:hypothetical protein